MSPLAGALTGAPAAPEDERPDLSGRLQAYSRYVAVIAAGLDALQRRDIPRLQELAEERRRLEEEIAAAGAGTGSHPPAPPASEFHALLERGMTALANEAELDEWERQRWESLQDGALLAARGLGLRPQAWGEYRDLSILDGQLDLRF